MAFDLIIANARLVDHPDPVDIGVIDGQIAAIAAKRTSLCWRQAMGSISFLLVSSGGAVGAASRSARRISGCTKSEP